jgi:putative ABC transport system substrate-binding protein
MTASRRRLVLGLAGGAALAGAFAARAQQPPPAGARLPEVGFLYPASAEASQSRVGDFLKALGERGFADGRNFTLLVRATNYDPDRVRQFAAELVGRKPGVIFAIGPKAVRDVRGLTSTIPIVAMDLESDPVASGFVASIGRPGGNLTGLFFDFPEFSGKWLEILTEILPRLHRVGLLWDPASGAVQLNSATAAVAARGLGAEVFKVEAPAMLGQVIAGAAARIDALIVLSSPVFGTINREVAELALGHRMPAISMFPEFAERGGLVAYGVDQRDLYRQGGEIVARILGGARPADLPVERPARFQLVLNLKTAKMLDLSIPPVLLARADQVIE